MVLGLLLISPPANAGAIGSGELKLKPQAVNAFIEYIKMKDKPRLFLVPIDGSSAYTWRCPASVNCVAGGYTKEIGMCERYFKKDCAVFARFRTIKWNNGINKGKKESKFNSKMTGTEIKAKLTVLGFLGGTTSTTTKVEKKKVEKKKAKITKKEPTQTDDGNNITQQLKDLNEMYKSGALTKEEFEKAKKKLLN